MDAVTDLVSRSQNGDRAAFEQLVLMYQTRIYSLSYQLTGNHADAQDLAQEVFIRAYKGLKSFRREADFGTWLHRIAVNIWLNVKRRRDRANVVSLDEPVQTDEGEMVREVAAADGDPVEALEEKEFRGLVGKALGEMSAEHKAVLVLREIEGHSYEEIAAIMDCSVGTVRSRLNRARETLKKKVAALAAEMGLQLPDTDRK